MSGLVISLSWGAFIYGLYALPKLTPHTEDYNCTLTIVVCAGILGPGATLLVFLSACWRLYRQERKQEPLLPNAVYIV